ncbi:MAG: sulfatase-like hydrolase/transferase, partial [Chloroflexi bacterium]|nr:sulfatase-like hydrolase/transferase [Chloroflexota bacterium]
MERERKNILVIMTDQQRWDSLACSGAGLAHTPAIDALAARGMRFTQAYTPVTVCSPARASFFTGLYPHQHKVIANSADLDLQAPNLARRLLTQGYRLGYTGKWHIDDVYGPTHFGFEARDWLGYSHPAGGVILRSFAHSCKYPVNHYLEYLKERGLEVPHLEEAVYFPANEN